VYRSQLDIDQMIPGASPMEPPAGSSSFEGDGYAVGCNFGLTWQMAKQHRLAVTYRSPFDVDYEGDTEVTSLTPGFGVPPSDFKTTMNFPAIVGIGYGVELTDTVRVEINAEWLEHSRLENINLDAGSNNGLLLAAMGTTTLPQNWQDGWTFGAGGDWRFAPNWMLRAGFLYMETPVPVQTLMPSVAEEDNEVLSLGVGYRKGAHALDAAYAVGLFDGRDVAGNQNPMFDGNYDFESHLMALSYSYSF
jgi:long-chain fatty acid transport protein